MWDLNAGTLQATLEGHTDEVWSAEFSPDGNWVLTGSLDNIARIHDHATGRTVTKLLGHTRSVSYARFSGDGKQVVTTSQDRTARLWNADSSQASLELRGHLRAVANVAFDRDSTRLVTAGGDDTARIWNVVTGGRIRHLSGHDREVSSAVFSAAGTRILTGSWDATAAVISASEDRTAYVWDAATGRPLAELRGHAGGVDAVAFSADGKLIATGGDDGAARIHQRNVRTTVEDLLAQARDRVTRELTPEERTRYVPEEKDGSTSTWRPSPSLPVLLDTE